MMFNFRAGSGRGGAGGACVGGAGYCSWVAGGALNGARGMLGAGLGIVLLSFTILRTLV